MTVEWSEAETQKLRELWAIPEIGVKDMEPILGYSVGAICSKRIRIGLPPRPNDFKQKRWGARARDDKPKAPASPPKRIRKAKPKPATDDAVQPAPAPTFAEIIAARHPGQSRMPNRNECVWPCNDAWPWLFCCDPVEPDRPYCADHCWLAYPRLRG